MNRRNSPRRKRDVVARTCAEAPERLQTYRLEIASQNGFPKSLFLRGDRIRAKEHDEDDANHIGKHV
jgi:hypothetical protein